MEPITYNIRLDTSQAGAQATLNARRGDARMRRIIAHLYSGSTPYELPETGAGATLWAKKPDGTRVFKNCEIEGDVITVTLTSNMLAAVGTVNCELQVLGSDGALLTSPRFDISVEDKLMNDDLVESTDEFTALTEALIRVEDIEESEQERKDAEEQRKADEEARAEAEEQRAEAEQERIAAEDGRKAAEDARIAAEEARAASEKAREAAEAARSDAEAARVLAEEARKLAEEGRVAAENGRAEAETLREQAVDDTLADVAQKVNAALNAAAAAVSAAEAATDNANTAADDADAATDRANKAAKACEDIVAGLDITWDALQGKPETFPPSAHTHVITDVVGLTDALNAKAAKSVTATAELSASGWSGNAQTAAVDGMTAEANALIAPAPASHEAYAEAGVYASAQDDGTLTFMCSDVPTADLTVNVLIAG